MRHTGFTAFVAFLTALPVLAPAPDVAVASGEQASPRVPPAPPAAAQNSAITETIRLEYAWPGDVIRNLRQESLAPVSESEKPTSGIPVGIRRISYDNAGKTITVSGSAAAIADLKALLRLMA